MIPLKDKRECNSLEKADELVNKFNNVNGSTKPKCSRKKRKRKVNGLEYHFTDTATSMKHLTLEGTSIEANNNSCQSNLAESRQRFVSSPKKHVMKMQRAMEENRMLTSEQSVETKTNLEGGKPSRQPASDKKKKQQKWEKNNDSVSFNVAIDSHVEVVDTNLVKDSGLLNISDYGNRIEIVQGAFKENKSSSSLNFNSLNQESGLGSKDFSLAVSASLMNCKHEDRMDIVQGGNKGDASSVNTNPTEKNLGLESKDHVEKDMQATQSSEPTLSRKKRKRKEKRIRTVVEINDNNAHRLEVVELDLAANPSFINSNNSRNRQEIVQGGILADGSVLNDSLVKKYSSMETKDLVEKHGTQTLGPGSSRKRRKRNKRKKTNASVLVNDKDGRVNDNSPKKDSCVEFKNHVEKHGGQPLEPSSSAKKRKRKKYKKKTASVLINNKDVGQSGVAMSDMVTMGGNTKLSVHKLEMLNFQDLSAPYDRIPSFLSNRVTHTLSGPQTGCAGKKLLILDLNGILVDIVSNWPKGYVPNLRLSKKKSAFVRPHCDDFLRFCFEKFNVGIWSSRHQRNVKIVVDFLLGDYVRKLLFCWDQSHCTLTGFNTLEMEKKPLFLKVLKKLWENRAGTLPWSEVQYNESNTLLLDDSPHKALCNPAHTAIFPCSYHCTDVGDRSLGPGGDLRVYLERLSEAENVQEFVAKNPFGQQAITDSNPAWDFYCRVINSVMPCES